MVGRGWPSLFPAICTCYSCCLEQISQVYRALSLTSFWPLLNFNLFKEALFTNSSKITTCIPQNPHETLSLSGCFFLEINSN